MSTGVLGKVDFKVLNLAVHSFKNFISEGRVGKGRIVIKFFTGFFDQSSIAIIWVMGGYSEGE